jgi:alpha-N-acetylglucosaminidase
VIYSLAVRLLTDHGGVVDWMALRGINLPLAWVGVEKIFVDVFEEAGFNDEEIDSFLSGPAFQAWNRFGNIQGSWGGSVPREWINDQFALQLKIVERMAELGMSPVLPAFPGFVPKNVSRIWPDASTGKSPLWSGFTSEFSAVTFLDPFDDNFLDLQHAFMSKQLEYYGNVTHYWTLDQFNENRPANPSLDYLHNVSRSTWEALKAVDPDAVWIMQGWIFASDPGYWTNARIEAFLGGVPDNTDMLILDLFAESRPQWQRTQSFYGKNWIWCQLHDFGQNMGLYGQVENVTRNSIQALEASDSIAGFGLCMEGQEGNEIMYDLLLDQSWSKDPLDTEEYFDKWVSARYSTDEDSLPEELYVAWDTVRGTVYNNTDLRVTAVAKSILELLPNISGLQGRLGHHATVINYDPKKLAEAWRSLRNAAREDLSLIGDPSFQYDLTDWTRQVLVNHFDPLYEDLIAAYRAGASEDELREAGDLLTSLLESLDLVLSTNKHFRLETWINAARATANTTDSAIEDFFEYNARNQITLWGPRGEIEDYGSKQWSGLVGSYYQVRWEKFVDYLVETPVANYNHGAWRTALREWEKDWNLETAGIVAQAANTVDEQLLALIDEVVEKWSDVFGV